MTGIEDTLTYKAAEVLAYEYPQLDAELKEALFDIIGKLKEPIIYHVLGSGRSAAEVIGYLANAVTRDYDTYDTESIPAGALRDIVLNSNGPIMITPSWINIPLNTDDCYITAKLLLGPKKVELFTTHKYAYLDLEGLPIHQKVHTLTGSDIDRFRDLINGDCRDLKESYEEGIKFLAKQGVRPMDVELRDTIRERLATLIIKEFHAYGKDSKLRLFHLADRLTPVLTQHVIGAGLRIDWVPRELGENYVFREKAEPLIGIIEWALDNEAYIPVIHHDAIVIPVNSKDLYVSVGVTPTGPKVRFFGFPKVLPLTRTLYPAYAWTCEMTDRTNHCGSYDPDAIIRTLEEKVAELMSKEEAELNEAGELVNEMLRGGGKK
jgi:hypothetical protein